MIKKIVKDNENTYVRGPMMQLCSISRCLLQSVSIDVVGTYWLNKNLYCMAVRFLYILDFEESRSVFKLNKNNKVFFIAE